MQGAIMDISSMHVAVTGGAGFIGSHSVEALLAKGARVTVLDNFSTGGVWKLPAGEPQLTVIEGDIPATTVVARALKGVTHVLPLAAHVSVQASVEAPNGSCSHNVVGFLNVLDAA